MRVPGLIAQVEFGQAAFRHKIGECVADAGQQIVPRKLANGRSWIGDVIDGRDAECPDHFADEKSAPLVDVRSASIDTGRQDSVREVVDLLKAVPANDHEFACQIKLFECSFGRFPVPPPCRFAGS